MDGVTLDKQQVRDALRRTVEEDLRSLRQSQLSTQEGATHVENRSEHSKDTRATESSYLARGLADRVVALENTAASLTALELVPFDEDSPIGVSALVTLENEEDGTRAHYFLVPAGGGLQLDIDGAIVRTLTPTSPLGEALIGKCCDDDVEIRAPQGLRTATIVSVR